MSSVCYVVEADLGIVSVFLGLVGLTMLEYSLARKSFAGYILIKNFIQFSIAVVSFWLIGYAFAYGENSSNFIGEKYFGGEYWLDDSGSNHGLCYSYTVLVGIFIVYIINLALIEKASYIAYVFFPFWLIVWFWPVIVSWTWGNGWLYDQIKDEVLDYGGSITVFTFAGGCALAALLLTGKSGHSNFRIQSHEIYVLGSFLTILGVYGIGSAQQVQNGFLSLANLWVGGGICSLVSLKFLTVYDKDLTEHYIAVYQGFIAGMVAAASSAGNSQIWVVALHSLITALFFSATVWLVKVLKIDDRANVLATFCVPGIYGGILPGFIDNDLGVYYHGWESGQTLGTNVVGTSVIFCWAVFWGLIVFGVLAIVKQLRLNQPENLDGAVITQMGFSKGYTEPDHHN